MENTRLLQELIENQKSYQVLLQQVLEEQRAQVNALTRLCENMNKRIARQESGYNSTTLGNTPSQQVSLIVTDTPSSVTPPYTDQSLVDWLRYTVQVDEMTIERFVYEQYTLDDVLNYVMRDDIRRLNLRGGIELRIWQAILKHRENNN